MVSVSESVVGKVALWADLSQVGRPVIVGTTLLYMIELKVEPDKETLEYVIFEVTKRAQNGKGQSGHFMIMFISTSRLRRGVYKTESYSGRLLLDLL